MVLDSRAAQSPQLLKLPPPRLLTCLLISPYALKFASYPLDVSLNSLSVSLFPAQPQLERRGSGLPDLRDEVVGLVFLDDRPLSLSLLPLVERPLDRL